MEVDMAASCHQIRATRANQLNAAANQANVSINQANADANKVNAEASRKNALNSEKILQLLQTMRPQIRELGDKLEATRKLTSSASTDEIRVLDDIESLRRSSIAVEKVAKTELERSTLSMPQLAAVASAASAFAASRQSVRVQSGSSIHSLLSPDSLGSPPWLDEAKRHKSSDDVDPHESSPIALPTGVALRPTASSPAVPTVESLGLGVTEMTIEQFEEEMTRTVSRAEARRKSLHSPFEDSDVDTVSALLLAVGKARWSERPRTYLVLRLIGEIRAIESFILDGYKDIHFPFAREEDLPRSLPPKARRDFMHKQSLVLSSKAVALVSGGRHAHLENADTRFKDIETLGTGGQGVVDKVTSKLDLQIYARKRIRKTRELSKNKSAMISFENEIHNLKRLQHKHLVQFVGSYTDRRYVGIIMEPVADMDLKQFLARSPFPEDELDVLRSFFGCLCSALRYLHDQNCRHKDIKPANILVKHKQVYITDFGLALDWTELTSETTTGAPAMYTHAYAAPEVAVGAERNTKSDVWSLGCVYLDMLVRSFTSASYADDCAES
jgi:hypothetical protein